MKFILLFFISYFLFIENIAGQCKNSITRLHTQQVSSTVVNATINFENPNADNVVVKVSYNNGLDYSDFSTILLGTSTLISNLPKQVLFFKIETKTNSGCTYVSEPVSSIQLNTHNDNYGQIDLNWNSIASNANYDVFRSGVSYKQNLAQTTFTDLSPRCNQSYLYQVIGKYSTPSGKTVEVTSQYANAYAKLSYLSPSKEAIAATVLDDQTVSIKIADATGSLKYSLYNAANNSLITQSNSPEIIHNVDVVQQKPCYYINFEDDCGFPSLNSPTFCPIVLEHNSTDNTLYWNRPVNPLRSTISYELKKDGVTVATSTTNSGYSITPPSADTEKYQVFATITFTIFSKVYTMTIQSNVLTINYMVPIYVPTAFSPNNDSLNDEFKIFTEASDIKKFRLSVFNRWGNIIFESNQLGDGWNGLINSTESPADIYTYVVEVTNKYGLFQKKTGAVSLLR